jgi:hypothetical protein
VPRLAAVRDIVVCMKSSLRRLCERPVKIGSPAETFQEALSWI